jgi:hypothetical protein
MNSVHRRIYGATFAEHYKKDTNKRNTGLKTGFNEMSN